MYKNDIQNNIVAKRIKELRNKRGLTQEELAFELGLENRQSVAKWESGENMPKLEHLRSLAVFFDVSSEHILGLTRYRRPENEKISELTGLSDESIEVLRTIKERQNQFPSSVLEKGTLDFINYILEKTYTEYFPMNELGDKELIYTLFATMNEYVNSANATVYYREKNGGLWTDYSNDIAFSVTDKTGANKGEYLLTDGNELYSESKLRIITNTLYEYRKGGTNNG